MILLTNNKFVKQAIKLKNKKERDKTGLAIIEGERFIEQIKDNAEIVFYIFSKTFYSKINNIKDYKKFYIVEDNIFKKISDTVTPQGIAAICKPKKFLFKDINIKNDSLILTLDRITDPGNLGTIIRTACALGACAIILSKGCVDLYNPKVLRSSAGALFSIPILTNCDLIEIFDNLKSLNFNIFCSHLNAQKDCYNINFLSKTAIIIGNEANGVLDKYVSLCDDIIKIPMCMDIESINASIATSIILYEVLRQKMLNN